MGSIYCIKYTVDWTFDSCPKCNWITVFCRSVVWLQCNKCPTDTEDGKWKVHDFFLLQLCKSSIWFTEQHIFKIILYISKYVKMCHKLCYFICSIWWFHRSNNFEAMKAGKSSVHDKYCSMYSFSMCPKFYLQCTSIYWPNSIFSQTYGKKIWSYINNTK